MEYVDFKGKKTEERKERKREKKSLQYQPARTVVRSQLIMVPIGTISNAASIRTEDDKSKDLCYAVSPELHVFHQNLTRIPTCCCE